MKKTYFKINVVIILMFAVLVSLCISNVNAINVQADSRVVYSGNTEQNDVCFMINVYQGNEYVKAIMSMIDLSCAPAWVTVDKDALKVTFERVPQREELDPEIKEQLVIEYYSK